MNQFRLMFEVDPLLEEAMGDLWALVRVEGSDSSLSLNEQIMCSMDKTFNAGSPE